MTERYQLRPITPEQFNAYGEVSAQAFNDNSWAETGEQELLTFEFDRSLAAFDGDAIVGTAAALSFRLTVPGGIADAAGVTFVSVLPSHRRQGILSAMMRQQLADIAGRGEAIAALFSSESGIYGRYGYGCASGQLRLAIRRGEGKLSPGAAGGAGSAGGRPGAVRLRTAPPGGLLGELAAVYDSVLPHRPGMTARDERWWQSLLADPESRRQGMSTLTCLLAADDVGPRGYALYRTRPDWGEDALPAGLLSVRELMAGDAAATAALWADLLTRDLIT
jgi:predicted acetyltransferase